MALQALPQAIQYDNTANQMLARLADDLRQQRIYEQRLRQEDEARKFQLLQSISPEVLSEKYDKEVVNASIAGLRDNVTKFLAQNKTANSFDLQENIQRQLGDIAQRSNKMKLIRENIANTVKELKNSKGIDVAGLQAAALTRALKNPDGSLKSTDQLNADIDWASDTYAQAPDKFIDIAEVGKGFEDRLNKAQKIDRNKTVQVIKDGKKVLDTLKYTINPWQDIDEQGNVVTKKTPEGYLVPEQFQALVPAGSVDDVYWTRLAKNRMAEHNAKVASGDKEALKIGAISLDDPGNLMQVKWALVTNYLDQKSGSKVSDINKQEPIRVTVNTGGSKSESAQFVDGFAKIENIIAPGKQYKIRREGGQGVGGLINQLDSRVAETLVSIANKISTAGTTEEGTPRKYTQRDLVIRPNQDGSYQLIDINTKEALPPINREDFNTAYNETFGNKAQSAAVKQPTQPAKPAASGIKWK